jgi:hypothetical protein
MGPGYQTTTDLSMSLKTSESSLSVPKLRDDGSNWPDYEPRIKKAMGAKGIWKFVEGVAYEPKQYTKVGASYFLPDGVTQATEEQIEA